MSCEHFEQNIHAYLAQSLGPAEQSGLQAHLSECVHCVALVRIFATKDEPSVDADLTTAILRQTSGTVCTSARDRLPDLVDGRLQADEAGMVENHAQACDSCRAVLVTLEEMVPALQSMAQIEPDTVLVEDVVHATTRQMGSGWLEVRVALVASAWRRLLARPRFAYEAGYGFTVAIVLLMALPVSPLRHVPIDGLAVLRGEASLEEKSDLWRRLRPVRGLGARALHKGGDLGTGVSTEVASRRLQMGRVWPRMGNNANRLGAAMLGMEVETIPVALDALGCDLRLLWDGLHKRLPAEGDLEC